MCVAMPAMAQAPAAEKWAPGEFAKVRRQAYDAVYDRVAYLGPYAKWLMEEVGTIITHDEQVEFEGLGSDAARNVFIQRFWARRDEKFKESHYEKLKLANSRWGVPGNRGFLADREFFYMIYGPADQIAAAEDHTETWTYANYHQPDGSTINVTFKFDANGDITPETNPFRKPKR